MNRKRSLKICSLSVLLMLLVLLCGSCVKKAETASASSFASAKWTLIGPCDEPGQGPCTLFYQDLLAEFGSESTISSSGLPKNFVKTGKIQAKKNLVDFGARFPGKNYSVSYAYLEFEGNGEEVFYRMGSDDGLRVWLNGELMVDQHAHRAIDPNSNSFRAMLKKGTNRVLVKVCQGTGDWGFTFRETSRNEHEAFLSKKLQIDLFLSANSLFLGNKNTFDFSILTNPAPLQDVPLTYIVTDSEGKLIARGTALAGKNITVEIPSDCKDEIYVTAESGEIQDALTREKLQNTKLQAVLFKGDRDTVLRTYSEKARKAVQELGSSSTWASLDKQELKAIEDVAPTLLYLAEMIDGNLHQSLVSENKKMMAVSFINDILEAMKESPQALSSMTGYRQMAYRSIVDNSIQPYSLYLPKSYSPDKTYSLIVVAHGYSGDDYGEGSHLTALMPEDFIIVSVFGRGDVHYQSVGEQDVLDVMDRIIDRYPIDENRVYMMGNSMGGLGTWRIGTLYTDRFAAIAPYCGWTSTAFMKNLGNTKTYVVHGDADTTVPVKFDRACVNELKKLGYDVTYVEIPNGSHSAWAEWSMLYEPGTILDVFRSAVRNPSPDKIAAAVSSVRYGKHYWVTVNELDTSGPMKRPDFTVQTSFDSTYPLQPAPGSFEAQRSDDGSIQISTERINALSVDVKLADMNGKNTQKITIDKTSIVVPANAEIVHLAKQTDGRWGIDIRFGTQELPRHDGGGVADLFTQPLILVYGTQKADKKPILEAAARELADWSIRPTVTIGVKSGTFKVKADTELTEEDMASHHILLFGTPEENAVSALFQQELAIYYQDGDIFVAGQKYTDNGLCVTMPNPRIPGKMIGYMDISRKILNAGDAKQYFLNFQFRLRNSYINELMGTPSFCPDVFVMTSHPMSDAWSGWFDRYWENLQGQEAD